MTDKYEKMFEEIDSYDEDSRAFLLSIAATKKEISILNQMKATEGWKLMEKKIREELQLRILEKVKDDLKIQTLLALLSVADTNSMSKTLQAEIDKTLPS